MSLDLNATLSMLRIVEKSRDYPRLKAIHDEVMKQLEAIAKEASDRLAKAAEEARAKAEQEAKAKAKADEERVLKDEVMKPRPSVVNIPEPPHPPEVVKVPESFSGAASRPPLAPEPAPMQRRSDV